jgi:DNA-binding response OmpR family regulator
MTPDTEPLRTDSTNASTTKKKLLLVEDDRIIQRALRDLLRDSGYDILHAYDGSEGVSQARSHHPNLIILDLGLPATDPFAGGAFDGFEVMRWLGRLTTDDAKIPVIILTARQDPQSRQTAMSLGASAYLTKPFKPDELIQAIRIVLDEI